MKTVIPEGFYTTKINLEVTLSNQFGPEDAIKFAQIQIGKGSYPIIQDMKIISVKTNFPEKLGKPMDVFRDYVL